MKRAALFLCVVLSSLTVTLGQHQITQFRVSVAEYYHYQNKKAFEKEGSWTLIGENNELFWQHQEQDSPLGYFRIVRFTEGTEKIIYYCIHENTGLPGILILEQSLTQNSITLKFPGGIRYRYLDQRKSQAMETRAL
jgi:hypothetical protein